MSEQRWLALICRCTWAACSSASIRFFNSLIMGMVWSQTACRSLLALRNPSTLPEMHAAVYRSRCLVLANGAIRPAVSCAGSYGVLMRTKLYGCPFTDVVFVSAQDTYIYRFVVVVKKLSPAFDGGNEGALRRLAPDTIPLPLVGPLRLCFALVHGHTLVGALDEPKLVFLACSPKQSATHELQTHVTGPLVVRPLGMWRWDETVPERSAHGDTLIVGLAGHKGRDLIIGGFEPVDVIAHDSAGRAFAYRDLSIRGHEDRYRTQFAVTTKPTSSRKRSRVVSGLTEEQIRHKRNVGRKAQRTFRQRNRDCITNLEQQFTQFKGTCAELRESCNKKDAQINALREENKSFLSCLETISECITATLRQTDKVRDEGACRGSSQSSQARGRQPQTQTPDHQEEPERDSISLTHCETPSLHHETEHSMQHHSEELLNDQTIHHQILLTCTNHAAPIDDESHIAPNSEDTTCCATESANAGLPSPPGSHQASATSSYAPYYASSQFSAADSHTTQHETPAVYSPIGGITASLSH
ncbi:hypothetical protein EDB80DRAFT_680957 [Ilyonectria destructans]|nr:hypothetical protein EDB80DRAFT_680957 [Ilyonectria destructans]